MKKSFNKRILGFIFAVLLFATIDSQAQGVWPQVVESKDRVPISYEVHGAGEQTLVFVHGWSCDARYWRKQIPAFSGKYKVVVLDLAGHGHSGLERDSFSMQAFGEDVKSVVEATGSKNVILIGHSMGGPVVAQAARLMPKRVKGLIGVDTFENIEYPLSEEEFNMMVAPLQKDFKAGTQVFVQQMLYPGTEKQLNEWIIADMCAAPPTMALSVMEEVLSQYLTGEASKIFEELNVPVVTVNGDLWPIDYEANRRHMSSFDAIVIKDADHFLMMKHPEKFNEALERAIKSVMSNKLN